MTDRLAVTMQIAQRVYALSRQQHSPALLVGAYRALASTLYHLGEFEAARRHARRGIHLWRSGYVPAPVEEVHAPAVLCLCYAALAEWHLGKIAACRAAMAEAISMATELSDTHALALALFHAASLGHFDRDPAEVERLTADLIAGASSKGSLRRSQTCPLRSSASAYRRRFSGYPVAGACHQRGPASRRQFADGSPPYGAGCELLSSGGRQDSRSGQVYHDRQTMDEQLGLKATKA